MTNLTKASQQLFSRRPDERFANVSDLWRHCQTEKEQSTEQWHPPSLMIPEVNEGGLVLRLDQDGAYVLNDWSFSQLCRQSNVSKDTVNRVTADTACRVLRDTLPTGAKPVQVFTQDARLRSIHGTSYTRLFNADLLTVALEAAEGFRPPQPGLDGGTGLYCGEQDMFCFLIDPTGWTEIGGSAFAPGFFLWNSEVGRRTVGVQTFWFQAVCQNHIVWDTTEVMEFERRHTGDVQNAVETIRGLIGGLAGKRDERRDGFVQVMGKAMRTWLGNDADTVLRVLEKQGIGRMLGKKALALAQEDGIFTVFTVVDALTRLSQKSVFAADRTEADSKAARLLALAA